MARIPASIEPLLPVSRARQDGRAWVALLAVALALRVVAAVRAPIIESDGAYYAGLARALLAGDLAHAWSTAWPPLYPWATAAVAAALKPLWLDPTPEVLEGCARAVSVAAGVALMFPLRRLAMRLLDRRGAWLALVFAAVHPRLLEFSGAALTESLFSACIVAGVAAWMSGAWLVAGLAFGLSYLARPEGALIAAALWAGALLFGARRSSAGAETAWRSRLRLGFVAGFMLVALPHLVVLESRLGHVSLGEKGAYNFWREHRAAYDRVLPSPTGLAERVNDSPEIAATIPPARVEIGAFLTRAPLEVATRTLRNFFVLVFSSLPIALYPLFALLAIAGAVGLPWRGWAPIVGVIVVLPFVYAPFTVDRRFFVPALSLALLLAARGWRVIESRLESADPVYARRIANALVAAVVLGLLGYFALRARGIDTAPEHREAGDWLGRRWVALRAVGPTRTEDHARPIVMSRKPWVAYYADGLILELPDGTLEDILERARMRHADILAVDERWAAAQRPALVPLLDPSRAPAPLRALRTVESPRGLVLYDVRGLW